MPSATLEVEDTDMKDWLDLMIALLEDNKHLGKLSSCKSAAGRIREVIYSRQTNVDNCLMNQAKVL